MTIETKYNYGDTVWLMRDNKIIEGKIFKIYTTSTDGGLGYFVEYDINGTPQTFDEDALFPSKEELLKSL